MTSHSSAFLYNHIADFGVAHIFDKLTSNDLSLPNSNHTLNKLTRQNTGLMTNTAGTNYFLAPECDDDCPYNAYAVDVGLTGVGMGNVNAQRYPFDFLFSLKSFPFSFFDCSIFYVYLNISNISLFSSWLGMGSRSDFIRNDGGTFAVLQSKSF